MEAPGILPNGFQKILNTLIKQFLLNVCFMSDTMAVVVYEGTKQTKNLPDGVSILKVLPSSGLETQGGSDTCQTLNWCNIICAIFIIALCACLEALLMLDLKD